MIVPAQQPSSVPCPIALVGEAPGEEEDRQGRPFCGPSGYLLDGILEEVGIARSECLVTNVFQERPPANNVARFFLKTMRQSSAPLARTASLQPERRGELERLHKEIEASGAKVIVPMGATALWALTGQIRITDFRGFVQSYGESVLVPTYHPAAVLRQYSHRHTVVADLRKAKYLAEVPLAKEATRLIWVQPTLNDLVTFDGLLRDCTSLCVDIETGGNAFITSVGISISPVCAFVIPFRDFGKKDERYWATLEEEMAAWEWLRKVLGDPKTTKVFQNAMYDLAYLSRYGIAVRGELHDTMLMAHSIDPESPKSLSYLASIYTFEPEPWKELNRARR